MPGTLMRKKLIDQEASGEITRNAESEPSVENRIAAGPHVLGPLRNYPAEHTSAKKKEKPLKKESPEDYDPLKDELRMIDEEKEYQLRLAKKNRYKYQLVKVFQVVLVVACVYLVFLIYGALNTNYTYDEKGEVVPVVVPVEKIREQNEFLTVSTQYLQARTLYERVLTLDYRIGMAQSTGEDPVLIAPEYEAILEDISKLSVQMSAITVSSRYTQPFNMLLSWVKDDLALYCQYISRAITQNSAADMNQALNYHDSAYSKFRQITQILATLGSTVENSDVESISLWSPEKYIEGISGGM